MSLLLPELEAFIAIIKFKTVHEAARNIGLTQTGVTQRIRNLEKNLGTSLFIRSRKGMEPTQEGLILYNYCQRFKGLEAELLHQVKGSNNSVNIRVSIAASSSITKTRVLPGISSLLKKYKNVFFTFNIVDDSTELNYLKTGVSQFAVINQDRVVNELDSKVIKSNYNILVGPSSWKKRSLENILSEEILIDFYPKEENTINYFKKFNLLNYFNPKKAHYINNTDALLNLISKGLAYSVLSKSYIQDKLDDKSIINLNDNKFIEQKLALVWYPRLEMPNYFKEIISCIK